MKHYILLTALLVMCSLLSESSSSDIVGCIRFPIRHKGANCKLLTALNMTESCYWRYCVAPGTCPPGLSAKAMKEKFGNSSFIPCPRTHGQIALINQTIFH